MSTQSMHNSGIERQGHEMRMKKEERKNTILEAAMAVFNEVGYETASMSAIAARAGGSKATLYSYFPSKTALFAQAIRRLTEREFGHLHTVLQTTQKVETVLYEYGTRYLNAALSPSMLTLRRIVQHEAGRCDVGSLVYEYGLKACWRSMADYLQVAMGEQRIRSADPWVSAMHLRALYEAELVEYHLLGIAQQVQHKTYDEVMRRAVDAFMAAYSPVPVRRFTA